MGNIELKEAVKHNIVPATGLRDMAKLNLNPSSLEGDQSSIRKIIDQIEDKVLRGKSGKEQVFESALAVSNIQACENAKETELRQTVSEI